MTKSVTTADDAVPMANSLNQQKRYPPWLWVFILTTLLITIVPYFWGYTSQGQTWQFTGFVFGVEDGNSYIAKMLRGASGDWLFRTPYTAHPQSGVLAFLPYLLLGKLSEPPGQHEQLVAIFQLFRILAGLLYILASYDFISTFIKDARWYPWGIFLATLGGGLGWVLLLAGKSKWLGSFPLDMFSPETFGFLSVYGLPHLALARSLMLWGFRAFLYPEVAPARINAGIYVGFLWLLMGLMQPLTVVLTWVLLLAFLGLLTLLWFFWGKRNQSIKTRIDLGQWWWRSGWIVLVSSPIVIYTYLRFNIDPVLKAWTSQNLILSPNPLHYIIAYGLLIPFAVQGVSYLIKQQDEKTWFLIIWTIALPFLVYAPYQLQRRLAEGYWIVLVILAIVSFEQTSKHWHLRLRWLLLFSFPTTVLLIIGGIKVATTPGEPAFRPDAEVQAFKHIGDVAKSDDIILADYETGNALPAWASVFVVIGHGPESIGLEELRSQVAAFYQEDTGNDQRKLLIEDYGIDYVFWGPNEKAYGDWEPVQDDFLKIIYNRHGYSIFRVMSTNY